MENFKILNRIKELYSRGENILGALRAMKDSDANSVEDILISYDFQAGSYTKQYTDSKDVRAFYRSTGKKIADEINKLGVFNSLLEVGVGEGTTLNSVLPHLTTAPKDILGFDISWSRLKFARAFLTHSQQAVRLFTGDLFDIPLPDNSVELVYTNASVEPNGGREKDALKELYRITSKYLVLIEPDFELADVPTRQRMREHGYVEGIHTKAVEMGFSVVEYRLWMAHKTCYSLIIIEKRPHVSPNEKYESPQLACPVTHAPLHKHSDAFLFSDDAMLAYPVLDNIPCLLKNNAILTVHLNTDTTDWLP